MHTWSTGLPTSLEGNCSTVSSCGRARRAASAALVRFGAIRDGLRADKEYEAVQSDGATVDHRDSGISAPVVPSSHCQSFVVPSLSATQWSSNAAGAE